MDPSCPHLSQRLKGQQRLRGLGSPTPWLGQEGTTGEMGMALCPWSCPSGHSLLSPKAPSLRQVPGSNRVHVPGAFPTRASSGGWGHVSPSPKVGAAAAGCSGTPHPRTWPDLCALLTSPKAWPAAPETLGPGDPRLFPKHLRPCQRHELGFPKAAWAPLTRTSRLGHTHSDSHSCLNTLTRTPRPEHSRLNTRAHSHVRSAAGGRRRPLACVGRGPSTG